MISRIKRLLQFKQLSASRFADELGVPRSTVSHILSGRNNPSLEFIQKVLDAYPDIHTSWLVRGNGPMTSGITTSLFPDDTDNSSGEDSQSVRSVFSNEQHASEKKFQASEDALASEQGKEPAVRSKPAEQPEKGPKKSIAVDRGNKEAVKVMLLYDDGTFDVFSSAGLEPNA